MGATRARAGDQSARCRRPRALPLAAGGGRRCGLCRAAPVLGRTLGEVGRSPCERVTPETWCELRRTLRAARTHRARPADPTGAMEGRVVCCILLLALCRQVRSLPEVSEQQEEKCEQVCVKVRGTFPNAVYLNSSLPCVLGTGKEGHEVSVQFLRTDRILLRW